MELRVSSGEEVHDLARCAQFRADWLALYEACAWATACQHPDFVLPWYLLYGERFQPVVVLARSRDGALQGLLTLALDAHGALSAAGGPQAEYHAWLAGSADAGNVFIARAIPALRAAYPGADLRLRYLPPGIPLDWMHDVGGGARHCVLRPHRRPVMRIDPEAMGRQRSKKNHRQNFNRLRRMGEVVFEKVERTARFAEVFEDICIQYDLRQDALYRQSPFQSDPMKKPFFLELHRRGLLHASLLTVGGEVAASHVGLLSAGRALHLGINTHATAFAAHSPGNLLLAMLGVHLAEEALPLLDLTPGGDEYKEHFANGHDLAFELVAYAGAVRRARGEAIALAAHCVKAGLRRAGYRPASALALLRRHGERCGAWFRARQTGPELDDVLRNGKAK
ncbi:MAG: GNAT family N-acetyltransferase [Janthinobacterium lividum]